MLTFLKDNLSTIIVCLILALIVAMILVKMVRDSKKGKSCHCGTACEGCASAKICHKTGEKP